MDRCLARGLSELEDLSQLGPSHTLGWMRTPDLGSLLSGASKIKLHGGVVGKVCLTLIVTVLAIAAVAWSARIVWVAVLALALIFFLVMILLWRLISFAERNPEAALLEGAEFIVHRQLMVARKGEHALPVAPEEIQSEPGVESHPGDVAGALEPDVAPEHPRLPKGPH